MLKINAVHKSFGKRKILDDLSLAIGQGEIYGLLGPNGCGKSTALNIIAGLILPDTGLVGFDPAIASRYYPLVSYSPEVPGFYPHLSGYENLLQCAFNKGLEQGSLEEVKPILDPKEMNKKFSKLSLGARQRLSIASAFLGNPALIILDEPTNGFDLSGILELRRLILERNERGTAFLIASHHLQELTRVSQRAGILHAGKISVEVSADQFAEMETIYFQTTSP